jgi:regulator of protease activity HflC (stomatin/prohibitin superfamily)
VNLVSIVSFLSVIAWMVTIGVVALLVIRSTRGRPMPNGFALLLVSGILALALSVLAAGLVFIQPSERGVVITHGRRGRYSSECAATRFALGGSFC